MAKILTTENWIEQLAQVKAMDWDFSTARGCPVLAQTKRNLVKAELQAGFCDYLTKVLDGLANVYLTNEGIAIELENDSVIANVPDGNGFITLMMDIKFKDLGYDAMFEAEQFAASQAQKAQAKLAKEAEKAKARETKKPKI